MMTIRDAVLKSLEEIGKPTTKANVYNHIEERNYCDFSNAKTPASSISAILGDFIRKGDSRVKRIKASNAGYLYYLSKNEGNIDIDATIEETDKAIKKGNSKKNYTERALHQLLATYLNSKGIASKTIYHEQSLNSKDSNQKWVHPDMLSVSFLNLQTKTVQSFLKVIDASDTFKISSYELKKEILTDYDLKQYFFQAVSNSSWANYGYLVAFEISDRLLDEMERLNQSFGIGIIELAANPFETKVLFPAHYKSLDFKTIDKLCHINSNFKEFIEHVEKLLTAEERYSLAIKKEFDRFCDSFLATDDEIVAYCNENNIPMEEKEE